MAEGTFPVASLAWVKAATIIVVNLQIGDEHALGGGPGDLVSAS